MNTMIRLKITDVKDMDARRNAMRPLIIREFEKLGALPITGSILELGAGDGAFNRCIVPLKSVQFDNDGEALGKNSAPSEKKVNGDATELGKHFKPKSFDWVIGHAFFYFFAGEALDRMLRDISSLLRPGGRILVLNDHAPPYGPLISEAIASGTYLIPSLVEEPSRYEDGTKKVYTKFRFSLLEESDRERISSRTFMQLRMLRKFISLHAEERHDPDFAHFLKSVARNPFKGESMRMVTVLTEELAQYRFLTGKELNFPSHSAYFMNSFSDAADSARLGISGSSFFEIEFAHGRRYSESSSVDVYVALAAKS
ncbi:Uncharacterised protein [uncultured archaeon]|nr:Uncharacterised protein [uncultured archaeon]